MIDARFRICSADCVTHGIILLMIFLFEIRIRFEAYSECTISRGLQKSCTNFAASIFYSLFNANELHYLASVVKALSFNFCLKSLPAARESSTTVKILLKAFFASSLRDMTAERDRERH